MLCVSNHLGDDSSSSPDLDGEWREFAKYIKAEDAERMTLKEQLDKEVAFETLTRDEQRQWPKEAKDGQLTEEGRDRRQAEPETKQSHEAKQRAAGQVAYGGMIDDDEGGARLAEIQYAGTRGGLESARPPDEKQTETKAQEDEIERMEERPQVKIEAQRLAEAKPRDKLKTKEREGSRRADEAEKTAPEEQLAKQRMTKEEEKERVWEVEEKAKTASEEKAERIKAEEEKGLYFEDEQVK
jgi:hypothetical protein